MADQLDEIKRKVDIVELISEVVPLKKAGRNFKGLCPFHSEKTPSFVVSPERQIWHCFGACNEGGDIFKFVMKYENIEFGEALKELAKRAGVKLTSYRPSDAERQKQLFYEINHLAAEFYHYLLLNHPAGKKALVYILGRGISKDSLEFFGLGFSPNSWDSLQKFLVGKKGYRADDLEKVGLVIQRDTGYAIRDTPDKIQNTSHVSRITYYDRFRNRLMFPLKDHRGNVCGFAGRVLDPLVKEAKYVNTAETPVYHKSDLLYGLFETYREIKKADQAILVEGELDAISSFQAGVKNIAAIKGSALTAGQAQLLGRFTKNISLALDRDTAGDQAARRGIETADIFGLAANVIELKGGKDPDEVAQKNPELWRQLVGKAVPVYDYFLDSAFTRFDGKTGLGKRQIGEELMPVLAKIADNIVKAHYTQQLAQRLGLDEEAIRAEIGRWEKANPSKETAITAKVTGEPEKLTRREILEQHLLALCFQAGKWPALRKKEVVALVKVPRFGRIIEVLGEYLKESKIADSAALGQKLPEELLETFNHLYLVDLGDLVTDEEEFAKEFLLTMTQLKNFDLKEKLKQREEEIKMLENKKPFAASDQEKLDQLQAEFRDLASNLDKLEV